MSVTTRREDNVGYVEIDYPPVNAIGFSVRCGLLDAVRWAEKEWLDRVIVCGKGEIFSAGADVCEFDSAPADPHLPDVLNAIEQSFVPWIAAINGVALGGGAEIAMACRMRIMATGARIGLPEVTLGVIPGAGGTQRLPRLAGLSTTLDMITSGKPVSATVALTVGLVHAVEAEPVDAAFLVNTEELGCIVPAQELPAPEIDQELIAAARDRVRFTDAGQIAPLRAIDVIEAGLTLPFLEGLAFERAAFLDLRRGEQAKALRHVFFAERRTKSVPEFTADTVETDDEAAQDDSVGKRILERYREAADTVLMDGSTPWEIDEAMVEFGFAMGPYSSQDLTGLDIAHARRRRQDASRDSGRRYIPIADRMIELGKLGKKTGAGWYRYPGGGGRVDDPIVADIALEEAHFAGIERVDYTAHEIRERLLLAMINEAAELLRTGTAQSASYIDLVTIRGYGFPRWRGGLMHYADTLGAASIVEKLEQFAQEDAVAWEISPLLKRCAAMGTPIADTKLINA
ncbi:MAG: enoyl-CoA hydratase-related protein [Granulosicoccus sp.]